MIHYRTKQKIDELANILSRKEYTETILELDTSQYSPRKVSPYLETEITRYAYKHSKKERKEAIKKLRTLKKNMFEDDAKKYVNSKLTIANRILAEEQKRMRTKILTTVGGIGAAIATYGGIYLLLSKTIFDIN